MKGLYLTCYENAKSCRQAQQGLKLGHTQVSAGPAAGPSCSYRGLALEAAGWGALVPNPYTATVMVPPDRSFVLCILPDQSEHIYVPAVFSIR